MSSTSKAGSKRSTAVALAAVLGAAAGLSGAPTAAFAAAPDCSFTRTVCLWENTEFTGARHTVQSATAGTGVCVDLAGHGWGAGRAESARNTGNHPATLYTGSNCTGGSYAIQPGGSYSPVSFMSNSIFVY